MTLLKGGTGRVVKAGDRVAIHYIAAVSQVDLSAGRAIESSLDRGKPVVFDVGSRRVLAGLERLIVGMQVGATWRIEIPPHVAYGSTGLPGRVGPLTALHLEIYVLDAVPRGSNTTFSAWFANASRLPQHPELPGRQDPDGQASNVSSTMATVSAKLQEISQLVDANLADRQRIQRFVPAARNEMSLWRKRKERQLRLEMSLREAQETRDSKRIARLGAEIDVLLDECNERER